MIIKKFLNWIKSMFIKKDTEIVKVLKSIDSRLAKLEKCVVANRHDHGARTYIATGHWNT